MRAHAHASAHLHTRHGKYTCALKHAVRKQHWRMPDSTHASNKNVQRDVTAREFIPAYMLQHSCASCAKARECALPPARRCQGLAAPTHACPSPRNSTSEATLARTWNTDGCPQLAHMTYPPRPTNTTPIISHRIHQPTGLPSDGLCDLCPVVGRANENPREGPPEGQLEGQRVKNVPPAPGKVAEDSADFELRKAVHARVQPQGGILHVQERADKRQVFASCHFRATSSPHGAAGCPVSVHESAFPLLARRAIQGWQLT
eukprot:14941117-Alexandrium_andersonii.AAC.2